MVMDHELYIAATSGDTSLFLQNNDADFFLQETLEKNTALHLAVRLNQKKFAEKIIHLHPLVLPYHANSKGDTPLHIAARSGHLDLTRLLTIHSDVKSCGIESYKELLRMANLEKDTALHDAVRHGHFEIVKLLVDEDQELTLLLNNNGESPLFMAVDRKLFGIACHILKTVPACSYRGRNEMNFLHAAVIRYHFNSFNDVWSRRLDSPIIFNPMILIYQVLTSTKLAFTRIKEVTITCELNGEADFMTTFIKHFPTAVMGVDEFGRTPLHYAAHLCRTTAIQLLLENNRHVAYIKDKQGMSALHIAAKEGHVFVMRQLITSCPEICELLDHRGRTALHQAVINGKANAVKFVLKTPNLVGLINVQDEQGNTALHLAAVHGHHTVITMLAGDTRVDKGAFNKEGFSAYEIILACMEFRRFQKAWITIKLELAGGLPGLEGLTKNLAIGREKDPIVDKEYYINRIKDVANTHLLVATIIATVTFAAGFTMPGGYESDGKDQGMAVLSKKPAFKAFVIADTLAFCCSAASVLIHFLASMYRSYNVFLHFVRFAAALTPYSIVGMTAAFISGTNVVLDGSSGLAIANLTIGCCFFTIIYIFFSN